MAGNENYNFQFNGVKENSNRQTQKELTTTSTYTENGTKMFHFENPRISLDAKTVEVIFSEIHKHRPLWFEKAKRLEKTEKYWKQVVDQVLILTGLHITIPDIRKLFTTHEKELNRRLKQMILEDKLTFDQREVEFQKWEMYKYVYYCRHCQNGWFEKYWLKKRDANQLAATGGNPGNWRKRNYDNSDWRWPEVVTAPKSMRMEASGAPKTSELLASSQLFHAESSECSKSKEPTSDVIRAVKVEVEDSEDVGVTMAEPEPRPSTSSGPLFDVDTEIDYIKAQCNRIIQERPESSRMLREVLLNTIIAFDKNDFGNNLEDFYKNLAMKHSK